MYCIDEDSFLNFVPFSFFIIVTLLAAFRMTGQQLPFGQIILLTGCCLAVSQLQYDEKQLTSSSSLSL